MEEYKSLILELDKLKSVYRKSYVTQESRNENSAEHSWQLAVALIAFQKHLPLELDFDRAIKIALLHDVCEIGAGDTLTYAANEESAAAEKLYLTTLQNNYPDFGQETMFCWVEYEQQESLESRWVRTLDKILPFILNLATEGKTWHDQNITKTMVIEHHQFIQNVAPDIFDWMMQNIQEAVKKGWLLDELVDNSALE